MFQFWKQLIFEECLPPHPAFKISCNNLPKILYKAMLQRKEAPISDRKWTS